MKEDVFHDIEGNKRVQKERNTTDIVGAQRNRSGSREALTASRTKETRGNEVNDEETD